MSRCVNCFILIPANQQYSYNVVGMGQEIISILEEWSGHELCDQDHICQECMNLLLSELNSRGEGFINSEQQLGHRFVCICCGISLDRRTGRRARLLPEDHPERAFLANIIYPRQIPANAQACNACWMRAHHSTPESDVARNIQGNPTAQPELDLVRNIQGYPTDQPETDLARTVQENPAVHGLAGEGSSSVADPVSISSFGMEAFSPNESQTMHLEGYSRTADSSNHCFVPECLNSERLRVPLFLKKKILTDHKIFVTSDARVCNFHKSVYNWEFLAEMPLITQFTRQHVIEMLDLLRKPTPSYIDFEDVENMSDHNCRFWTGLAVVNFLAILSCLNHLATVCKKPKTALAIYLIKIRTGEPIRRIASLLCVSKTLANIYLNKARDCLTEFYVPLHLGVDHISRENLTNRNLIIPQGLFGTAENNAIIICDGTYIYMQKSSNYLFQKQSYSLHKYSNLVKPFLLVATDGHIIDICGPYAATTSDANIMIQLFQNQNSPLRQLLRENDVFILDRGFRDSIPLLTSLGYNVFKPESLGQGETQLSTQKANKSRLVTLCRWVVEIVNGWFKQEFKLFRQKYFNVGARNLMNDFRVAGAILNNFHPVLTNRSDAQAILERAVTRMNMPNYLSEHVIGLQLNRRRANFVNINGEIPQLDVFPIMDMSELILFSLGTYQIRQARSYYGEHIRANGTFLIEINNDVSVVNVPGISTHETILIRGRIKSRHQSNKVYYTYILLRLEGSNWDERICGYYCSCIIGKRTVGSCAHVMTIVWYLGWARHQTEIIPPAQFLDSILIEDEE